MMNGKWLERLNIARAWMLGAALVVTGVVWLVQR
jgi:hypothetical protein